LMAALCVAILSIGNVINVMDVSLAFAAGLVVLVISTEYGERWAFGVYAAAGLLSLLFPVRDAAIVFLALGGWYPIVQKKINMLRPWLATLIKFLIFNAVLAILLVLSALMTGTAEAVWLYASLAVLGNLCFYLYDILLDRIMIWYILKLRKRLKF